MKLLKTILKCLSKQKLILFFLALQFGLCYFVTMKSYTTYKVMNSQFDKANKILDITSTYLLRSNSSSEDVMNGTFIKLISDISKIHGVKAVGNYNYTEKNKSPLEAETLSINFGMLNFLKLQLSEGRNFSPSDFKDTSDYKTVPTIIGSNLSSTYKLGDIIECPPSPNQLDNSKFEVVGILKSGQEFFKNNMIEEGPLNLNDVLIFPVNCDFAQIVNSYFHTICSIPSDTLDVTKKIFNKSKEYNIILDVSSIKNLITSKYEESLTILRGYLVINISMIVFSLFGIVVTMIMLVESRKREFGIRLATGASKSYLYNLILGEMLVTDVIGFIFGLLIYRLEGGITIEYSLSQSFFEFYNFKIIGTMIGISLALIVLFSLNVIVRIYKMEPRELIKGRD